MTDRHAWIEEGAHAVAPGVHRIPLPLPSDGLRAVNVYAIEADGGLVLIDSGWALANARDQLERSLAAIGAGLPDVRAVPRHAHAPRPLHTGGRDPAAVRNAGRARRGRETVDRQAAVRHSSSRSGPSWRYCERAGASLVADSARRNDVDRASQAASGTRAPSRGLHGALGTRRCGPAPRSGLPWATSSRISGSRPEQVFDLGTRTLTAMLTPGHTRGHVVFADASGGPAVCRGPRAAAHHPVDRIPGSAVGQAAAGVPAIAERGATDCRTCGCSRRTVRSRRARTAGSTSWLITTPSGCAAWPTCCRPARAPVTTWRWPSAGPRRQRKLADLDLMNQMLADLRDRLPPRPAGGAGPSPSAASRTTEYGATSWQSPAPGNEVTA